jgi:hypothetical protein
MNWQEKSWSWLGSARWPRCSVCLYTGSIVFNMGHLAIFNVVHDLISASFVARLPARDKSTSM